MRLIAPLMLQPYRRYLPTAFTDDLTMLEKVNKLIHVVEVYDEMAKEVENKVNEIVIRIDDVNKKLLDVPMIVLSANEPSNISNDVNYFWYKEL